MKKTLSKKIKNAFTLFSRAASKFAGSPWVFISALSFIIIWLFAGPIFGYSDAWQLIINTLTTIITFLMVFLIQNSQNRDFDSMELKLDKLISLLGQGEDFIDAEDLKEEDLQKLKKNLIKKSKNSN